MSKYLLLLLAGVLWISPAYAEWSLRRIAQEPDTASSDSNIRTAQYLLMDEDCTDSFSLDATGRAIPNGVDFAATQTNLFDTIGEAIDPSLNYGYGPQTSGSADGWCDSHPWVLEGDMTFAATEQVFFGPLVTDLPGFLIATNAVTVGGTNYSVNIYMESSWAADGLIALATTTAATGTGNNLWRFVTLAEGDSSSQITATDPIYYGSNQKVYIRLNNTDAGDLDLNIMIVPISGESEFEIDE